MIELDEDEAWTKVREAAKLLRSVLTNPSSDPLSVSQNSDSSSDMWDNEE